MHYEGAELSLPSVDGIVSILTIDSSVTSSIQIRQASYSPKSQLQVHDVIRYLMIPSMS